jgi:hypothetical protein
MGLLYVFPVSKEESDFVINEDETLILKTYGLPYIFWIYALCIMTVIVFMFLAIKGPVLKLISLGDDTDKTLGFTLLTFVGLLPLIILSFFFYEKRIIKKHELITLSHRIFWMNLFSETFSLKSPERLKVTPYLSSPNVARIHQSEENVGFQNKGYFVLWLETLDGKKIQIDRHSRKSDLEKLKDLITQN